jgi:hypothetical protein
LVGEELLQSLARTAVEVAKLLPDLLTAKFGNQRCGFGSGNNRPQIDALLIYGCPPVVELRLGGIVMSGNPSEFGWTQLLTIIGDDGRYFVIRIGDIRKMETGETILEERRIEVALDALSVAYHAKSSIISGFQ